MKNKRNPILENKKLGYKTKTLSSLDTSIPRCWWRKAKNKMSARVLIKCGDCPNKLEIYYDKIKVKNINDQVEINGVFADKKWWKELFKEIGIIE